MLPLLFVLLAADAPRKPNVVIILADDLGWADLGCYGSPHIRTPNLDRLAAQGIRFTHAYAASPWCSPTRISLYTGRYAGRLSCGLEEPLRTRADGTRLKFWYNTNSIKFYDKEKIALRIETTINQLSEAAQEQGGALLCSLVAGAFALLTPATGAAANRTGVVSCTPTVGESSILKVSPAAVPPPGMGKFGFKLKTTLDGCAANSQQLSDWVASKYGTPDGPLIAKAELTLSLSGYDNCSFGFLLPPGGSDVGSYPASGTVKIKWLDANGAAIKSAKPTSISLRINGMTGSAGFPGISIVMPAEGTVTQGLGVGAAVQMSFSLDLPTDISSSPWAQCAIGSLPIPGAPPANPVPLRELQLKSRPSININFPGTN